MANNVSCGDLVSTAW